MTHALKVGDILRCSWGYDQTNIDFYEVVKTSANTVQILEIESEEFVNNDQSMTGKSVPCPGKFKMVPDYDSQESIDAYNATGKYLRKAAKPMRKTPHESCGEPYVKIESYAYAYLLSPTVVAGSVKVFAPSNFSFYG